MRRVAASALLLAALSTSGEAQDVPSAETARRAAGALKGAATALSEARSARDQVSALTATVRAYEEGLAALRDGVRQAVTRERAIRLRFEAKEVEVSRLIGALSAMERSSGPLLLLHPGGPLGTARSGMIVSEITPALQVEAQRLKAELEELEALRQVQEGALRSLEDGLSGAQEARSALGRAISERTLVPDRQPADPEALAALLSSADTLDSFAASVAAVPLAGEDADEFDFRSLRGTVPLPVAGAVLRSFDEADAAGVRRPGIVIATAPLALVTAPAGATVRFVGPLEDYGNVIILEPQGGYLLVLAGLADAYVRDGEIVAAGAPLGLTGGEAPRAAEFLIETQQGGGGERTETLYMELRVGGAPVDPGQWFAFGRG